MDRGIEVIRLPHANMRDEQGQALPVTVVKSKIFSWYFSNSTKATHIVSDAGAVVPTAASVAQLEELILGKPKQLNNKKKGK